MKIQFIIYLITFLFVLMSFLGGCATINQPPNIVKMLVENYYPEQDIYILSYDYNCYEFIGCPLELKPMIGETVLIDFNNMKWIK